MIVKFTNHFLRKLEELIGETGYILRYERGAFKSGYCILKSNKVIVVNKFYSLEGKINSLIEIIKEIEIDNNGLSEKNKKLFFELSQSSLEF